MSYENKEYILQFFEGVHEEDNKAELLEVYRKAKAFDEIKIYMQSAEDKLCDEEYFNEDVYEEYYGIIESVIEHHSEKESGE